MIPQSVSINHTTTSTPFEFRVHSIFSLQTCTVDVFISTRILRAIKDIHLSPCFLSPSLSYTEATRTSTSLCCSFTFTFTSFYSNFSICISSLPVFHYTPPPSHSPCSLRQLFLVGCKYLALVRGRAE